YSPAEGVDLVGHGGAGTQYGRSGQLTARPINQLVTCGLVGVAPPQNVPGRRGLEDEVSERLDPVLIVVAGQRQRSIGKAVVVGVVKVIRSVGVHGGTR